MSEVSRHHQFQRFSRAGGIASDHRTARHDHTDRRGVGVQSFRCDLRNPDVNMDTLQNMLEDVLDTQDPLQ